MAVFIDWNIRGLRANREELQLLVTNTSPTVICLQETHLSKETPVSFNSY
jgi:exonuclease III